MDNRHGISTDSCWKFYTLWHELRNGDAIPHTRSFLNNPEPKFIPSVLILEVTEAGLLIRFMGTSVVERWGRDQTNTLFGSAGFPQSVVEAMLENCRALVDQPCGVVEVAAFSTRVGLPFRMETVMVPLGVDAGRPPRICSFSQMLDHVKEGDKQEPRFKGKRSMSWIDIGFGTPSPAPRVVNP
ncbi:MAG: PAS domain-containing protein [Rhodospirillaceae bacterium]